MYGAGTGVEALDVECLAAELIEGRAVVLSLFLASHLGGLPIDPLIFLPAGENNPAYDQGYDCQGERGIEERVLEDGFGFGLRWWKGHAVRLCYCLLGCVTWLDAPMARSVLESEPKAVGARHCNILSKQTALASVESAHTKNGGRE